MSCADTVWCKYPSLDTVWCNTDKKSLNATVFRLSIFFQDRIYYIRDEDYLRFGFGDEKQETGAQTSFVYFRKSARKRRSLRNRQTFDAGTRTFGCFFCSWPEEGMAQLPALGSLYKKFER